ncbi:hypothetical protein SCHPADRAFT_936383 [Schizopora paradoxa]|uniref:Yeast cell wall synthesis Kre9/Knh1-like N-terminal domain-containing protein n=1 Tax=Schizopora paradoxa TaxID=27342 RepID=A0A0H2SMI3_9AGAM|nr:hypothetical protein SCHPADRAFT_936383 [Schizopora paradoxa]
MKLDVVACCAGWFSVANAILYPVLPVANSVFNGGSLNTISWIDDGSKPSLVDMGPVSMDLYVDKASTKYLMNLAQDVDPRKKSQKVFIPPSIWVNSSTFYILFTSTRTKPPTTVYTADFTIINLTGAGGIHRNGSGTLPSNSTTAPPGSPSSKILNNGKSNPTTSSLVVSGNTASSQTQSTTSVPSPNIAPKSNAAPSSRRRQVSSVSRYNLVFVMWPALFGLAMAL